MPGFNTIEGLASGFNITEIVDKTIEVERIPVTFLEQDKAYKTQQVAAYKAILAKFLAVKGQIAELRNDKSFNKAFINVSDYTILSASATGRVAEGSYNLRVASLASNHQIASQGFDDATEEIFGTGTIKLSLGDNSLTTININAGINSLVGIKDAINDAAVGVTASIINDGSVSNNFRLLLTGDLTGATNDINFEISLSGGSTIELTNSSFDIPEILSFSDNSTSQVSLGASVSYSGNVNKIYTFTVQGSGSQIIGTDNITINWTDGTDSGAILVTQADNDVELAGAGSDGLSLSFSAGTLEAGDTFQVSTFAPLLQVASDAQIAIGSDGTNGGSPIVINSSSNSFDEVIPGLSLDVKKVNDPGESVTINTGIDTNAVKAMITDFLDAYNGVMKFIDDQFTYNTKTTERGVLFGEYFLQTMQSSFRSAATLVVDGIDGGLNSFASIGIRTGANGELRVADSSALTDALKNNYNDVIKLFTDSGSSTNTGIEFISASEKTVAGSSYAVNITQAATQSYYKGAQITDPAVTSLILNSGNNVLNLTVDGLKSNNIVLSEKTYTSGADLAKEIQTRINADDNLKNRGIEVEWVQGAGDGHLIITNGKFGSSSSVKVSLTVPNGAALILGLTNGSSVDGQDVKGTINGEAATGLGQVLVGDEDNLTTDGLKLKITLTAGQLGVGTEGTINIIKGLASIIDNTVENISKAGEGSIARITAAIGKQIDIIDKRISDWDDRLARRREEIFAKFLAMEIALGQAQAQGSFLDAQLAGLQNNWNFGKGSS